MTLPRGVVEIEDPSASQAAWRSMPERNKLIPALINSAEKSFSLVDVDLAWSLFEKAEEITSFSHSHARDLLIGLGLERWNEYGNLEINAPLLLQGPSAVRKLFEATLDPDSNRKFVEVQKSASGTLSGKRNKLTKSMRQEQDIARLKGELDQSDADRDATLRYAISVVKERNSLRAELISLFDQMQQLINESRAFRADPDMSDAEIRLAMHQVFRSEEQKPSESVQKEGNRR